MWLSKAHTSSKAHQSPYETTFKFNVIYIDLHQIVHIDYFISPLNVPHSFPNQDIWIIIREIYENVEKSPILLI